MGTAMRAQRHRLVSPPLSAGKLFHGQARKEAEDLGGVGGRGLILDVRAEAGLIDGRLIVERDGNVDDASGHGKPPERERAPTGPRPADGHTRPSAGGSALSY